MERFIRVRTKEDSLKLMEEVQKQGYLWQSKDLPTELEDWWEVYESDTVLYLEDLGAGKFLTYSSSFWIDNEFMEDDELLLQEFLSKEF